METRDRAAQLGETSGDPASSSNAKPPKPRTAEAVEDSDDFLPLTHGGYVPDAVVATDQLQEQEEPIPAPAHEAAVAAPGESAQATQLDGNQEGPKKPASTQARQEGSSNSQNVCHTT